MKPVKVLTSYEAGLFLYERDYTITNEDGMYFIDKQSDDSISITNGSTIQQAVKRALKILHSMTLSGDTYCICVYNVESDKYEIYEYED